MKLSSIGICLRTAFLPVADRDATPTRSASLKHAIKRLDQEAQALTEMVIGTRPIHDSVKRVSENMK